MKSWLFVDMLLFKMVLNPNLSAVCLREVQGTLDQSVKRLIDLRIKAHRLEDYFESTKSEIRSKRGSGIVVFKGLSKLTEAGIKSMESFDIWFIEEGQTISKASLAILMPTVRKVGSQVWIAWNPLDETVPVDELLRGKNRRQDATVIEVNFWDSPFFTDELAAEMEYDRDTDPEKFQWVWCGQYLKFSEARVFRNWKVEEFEAPRGTIHRFGLDWGFFPDPLAVVRGYIDGRKIYIEHEAYRVRCEVEDTAAVCLTIPEAETYAINCANDRPERVTSLRRAGINAISIMREQNSVVAGVEYMQGFQFIIHPRCVHTAAEFALFSRKTDPLTGAVLPAFKEGNDHCIAAIRCMVDGPRRLAGGISLVPKPAGDAALTSHWGGGRR